MIIGISGKIGSGKDTVGKVIQYLEYCKDYPHNSRSFEDWESNIGNHSKWKIKKFAGKLKEIASILTGIPVKDFEDQEFKQTILNEEWTRSFFTNKGDIFKEKMTVRQFLQLLGTEGLRNGLHTNVWVNALFVDYKPDKMSEDYPSKWIITDMRFSNEMEAVKERNGITIRVIRPHGYTNPYTGEYKEMPLNYHSSETALDDVKFDYEIINDGSIEELIEKVKEILIKENLL